eukprot:5227453-Pleurochrysis_carterae.AAC.3
MVSIDAALRRAPSRQPRLAYAAAHAHVRARLAPLAAGAAYLANSALICSDTVAAVDASSPHPGIMPIFSKSAETSTLVWLVYCSPTSSLLLRERRTAAAIAHTIDRTDTGASLSREHNRIGPPVDARADNTGDLNSRDVRPLHTVSQLVVLS